MFDDYYIIYIKYMYAVKMCKMLVNRFYAGKLTEVAYRRCFLRAECMKYLSAGATVYS